MLDLNWCDQDAARYAVMHWHYSRRMPIGKLVKVGAWEDDRFIGVVLFGRGATNNIGRPFDVSQDEVCELVRVALDVHDAPTSSIVAGAIKLLRRQSPGVRVVVSYADPAQGHQGTLYQAGNWTYIGLTSSDHEYWYDGRWWHSRMLNPTGFGGHTALSVLTREEQAALPKRVLPGKHRYVMPLDRAMRRRVAAMAQPYPSAGATVADTCG